MVGCPRPNRWLVEPDSTAGFTQRALVRMKKERAKTLISKNKNEPSAARALYVSLDRADNVIEGSIKGDVKKKHISLRIRGRGVSDIQPLTAAASSVPERGCA